MYSQQKAIKSPLIVKGINKTKLFHNDGNKENILQKIDALNYPSLRIDPGTDNDTFSESGSALNDSDSLNSSDISSTCSDDETNTDRTDQSIAFISDNASDSISDFDSRTFSQDFDESTAASQTIKKKQIEIKPGSSKNLRPKTAYVPSTLNKIQRPNTSYIKKSIKKTLAPKKTSKPSKTKSKKTKSKSKLYQSWYEIKPIYKSQKPTVCFAVGCETKNDYENRFPDRQIISKSSSSSSKPVLYYSMDKAIEYPVIKIAFKSAGFKRIKPHTKNWSVRWGRGIKHYEYEQMKPFQIVSHFPGSWNLGNKLKLHYNLMKMKKQFPKDYNFFPSSFVLPQDYDSIMKEYQQSAANNQDLYFILKPFNSSCGRGIRVVNKPEDIPTKEKCLSQFYIHNPLLINNKKFDMRIYVVVTSFNPLTLYRFNNGLARFSTEEYSLDSLGSFSHLTNYSINKHNEKFFAGDDDDSSSKWSLQGLRKYFADNNMDDSKLWKKVDELLIKALISVEYETNSMRKMHCKFKDSAFELLGFDVLIDETLKPWIIEINLGASLSMSSPLDREIKMELIHQMFHMVGFQSVNKKSLKKYKHFNEAQSDTYSGYDIQEKKKKEKYARDNARSDRIQQLKNSKKITKLLPEERKIIEKCEEEYSRRGDFNRIHPTSTSLKKYGHLFKEERYRNVVIGKFLELPEEERESLLERF